MGRAAPALLALVLLCSAAPTAGDDAVVPGNATTTTTATSPAIAADHVCAELQRKGNPAELCEAPARGCVAAFRGRRESCAAACEAAGLACASAYDDAFDDGRCPAGKEVACSRSLGSKVCHCALGAREGEAGTDAGGPTTAGGFGATCASSSDCAASPAFSLCHEGACRAPAVQLAPKREAGAQSSGRRAPMVAARCRLVRREVLTAAEGDTLAVQRLRFAMPADGQKLTAPCHAKVRAPDAPGQSGRVRAYSMLFDEGPEAEFELVVKIYPGGPPRTRGTSSFLGTELAVGAELDVLQTRSLLWSVPQSQVTHAGLIAFGIGIVEVLEPARFVLEASSSSRVRLLYANREEGHILYRDTLLELAAEFPGRFDVRHCLSRHKGPPPVGAGECGSEALGPVERLTAGRIDEAVVREEFGDWVSGDGHKARFLVVGSKAMENSAWGWLRELGAGGQGLFRGGNWGAPFQQRS